MKHTFDKTEGIFDKNKVLFDKKKKNKKKKFVNQKIWQRFDNETYFWQK